MPKPGFITASSFSDLMKRGRSGEEFGKSALRVIDLLTLDLLGVEREETTGIPAACQWGIDHEWEAIKLYEERTFRTVQNPVEFRVSPTHEYVGGTMDGLVGLVGGIEVKSPYSSLEHLANLQNAKQLYSEYWNQVQGYYWIYELEWIDFLSFDPRFQEPEDLYVNRTERDEKTIRLLQRRCEIAYEMACEKAYQLRGDKK